MKYLFPQLLYLVNNRSAQRNIKILIRFFIILIVLISLYSVLFHYLMTSEGQEHSWITGFYWTLTVMTTLGFGDITFNSDIGRIFSMFVLTSGVIFLLIMLPFTFIQFFYAPWMQAQSKARAPRELPANTQNHVIITTFDAVVNSF